MIEARHVPRDTYSLQDQLRGERGRDELARLQSREPDCQQKVHLYSRGLRRRYEVRSCMGPRRIVHGDNGPSACSLRFPCDNLIDKQRAVGVDSPFRRRVLSLSPAEARYTSRAVVRRPCPLHHFDRFRHPRGHGARVGEPPSVPDPARRRWYPVRFLG